MEGMKNVGKKIADLINVKTIVTFVITAVFAILALNDKIAPDVVMGVVTMVISFYFGTQHEKTGKEVTEITAGPDAETTVSQCADVPSDQTAVMEAPLLEEQTIE
jgi:hypothetical protein